jgi:WD40 repeat protein
VQCGSFLNDLVAVGTAFRVIIVWKVGDGSVVRKILGHNGLVSDVIWIKDEQLASVSDDRSIRVWEKDSQVAEMYGSSKQDGPQGDLQSASRAGQKKMLKDFVRQWKVRPLASGLLATVGEDASLRVFDPKAGRQVVYAKGHMGWNVRALAVSGNLVATGGEDGSVKVWQLDFQAEQAQLKLRMPLPAQSKAKYNQIRQIHFSSDSTFVSTKIGSVFRVDEAQITELY